MMEDTVQIKLLSGDMLIVNKDIYTLVGPYDWEPRKYFSKKKISTFVCRADNRNIKLHHLMGYKNIGKLNLEISFLDGNHFNYARENILLQKTWRPVPKEKRKRKQGPISIDKEKVRNIKTAEILENQCMICASSKRSKICCECSILSEEQWDHCLTMAASLFWGAWSIHKLGPYCKQAEELLR